jgi:hypothetical protein
VTEAEVFVPVALGPEVCAGLAEAEETVAETEVGVPEALAEVRIDLTTAEQSSWIFWRALRESCLERPFAFRSDATDSRVSLAEATSTPPLRRGGSAPSWAASLEANSG